MKDSFRQSQAWLHTWGGLVCGWLLFAIFFTGTTAVFRVEAQHWLQPELHRPMVPAAQALTVAERVLRERAPAFATDWFIRLPDARRPELSASWSGYDGPRTREHYRFETLFLDPATGAVLTPRASQAANMLYRFHFSLLLSGIGWWIVGAMAVTMLVLLVSGIVIHKKFFKDFFTFRPDKAPGRSWLDAHNVSSVMVLPFSLMITYTGLVIWWSTWMPAAVTVFDGDHRALYASLEQPPALAADRPSGVAMAVPPLVPFLDRARRVAPEGLRPAFVWVHNPGHDNAVIAVQRTAEDRFWGDSDRLYFDPRGRLLQRYTEGGRPAYVTQRVFRIVHEISNVGPLLRGLYFLMGAACCVMIATGLVLWTVKRREQVLKLAKKSGGVLAAAQMQGWRLAEALNVGTVAGILIATAVMFLSNRLLPAELAGRADWEIRLFFYAWMLSGLWALLRVRHLSPLPPGEGGAQRRMRAGATGETALAARPLPPTPLPLAGEGRPARGITARRLWSEQLGLAAGLYALIPLVNAIATPRSALWVTIPTGQWVVAGFDLTMLGSGLLLGFAAWKVRRPRAATTRGGAAGNAAAEIAERLA